MDIRLLNGDAGLFFKQKINRIPPQKNIIETIKKWIGKEYFITYDANYNGSIKRFKTNFKIKNILKIKDSNIENTAIEEWTIIANSKNRSYDYQIHITIDSINNGILYLLY